MTIEHVYVIIRKENSKGGKKMKYDLKQMRKKIAALLPASHPEGGKATFLVTTSGEKYLDRRSIKWILKRLARYFNIDLAAVKENYGQLLGRKRYLPLPFTRHLIYIPLTACFEKEGIEKELSYISLLEIAGIKKEATSNFLLLKSGIQLKCSNTLSTIEKRQREGRLVQKIIAEDMFSPPDDEPLYCFEGSPLFPSPGRNLSKEEIARITATILCFLEKPP